MRLAVEQLGEVAHGASPGKTPTKVVKLRSCDVCVPISKINVAAPQLFRRQERYDLRFHRRLSTTAAPQRIALGPRTNGNVRTMTLVNGCQKHGHYPPPIAAISCGAAVGGSPGREPWVYIDQCVEAAEQRRLCSQIKNQRRSSAANRTGTTTNGNARRSHAVAGASHRSESQAVRIQASGD